MKNITFAILLLLLIIFTSGCTSQQSTPATTSTSITISTTTSTTTTTTSTTTTTYDSLSMIAPYVNESDVYRMPEQFSSSADAPWGFFHPGIDFVINRDLVPFVAVFDGTVTAIRMNTSNTQQGFHEEVCIERPGYAVCYNFETFSQDPAVAAKQQANIFVKVGDTLKRGDLIGNLVFGGESAHIDFGFIITGQDRSCPEPYFTPEARESIYRLIHKDQPSWNMCYPSASIQNQTNEKSANQTGGWEPFPGDNVVNSLPDCTESKIFSYLPVSQDSYTNIMPLGHLNPPGHSIPTDHIYLVLNQNGSKSAITDVFSPGDITIYEIKKAQTLDSSGNVLDEDYGVCFSPCKQIRAWYGHMILSDELKAEIADTECREMGSPPGMKQCNYIINHKIKAGEYMGTTGGGVSACLDLGVYDLRFNMTGFANIDRYSSEYLQTRCPLDYFTDQVEAKMKERLGWNDVRRTVEPVCGALMQDVPGTAQGVWFDGPLSNRNLENEGKVISLVHDNMLGIHGKLIIGGQISQPGVIEFNPTHSGTINREPSEVTADGKIYCYQNDNAESTTMALSGKVILQLVDANTLKIEAQTGACSGSESFVNPYTYQR